MSFIAVMLANSNTTFAENNRYIPISFEGKIVGEFDTDSIKYDNVESKKGLMINVWVKTIPDQYTGEYVIYNYLFNKNDREAMLLNQISYDDDGEIISKISNKPNASLWSIVVPATLVDQWYVETVKYADKNHKKLLKKYNNTRKSDKNENSVYDKFNSWMDDIGNLFSFN
ncbi:DEAD/DEAH box helicase family protein [Anaerosinus massiliensis]|uniref:hypothetical protein n=1 Tax=Massilibacillus massiliensis TaxID=1806837 RepID=UPI0018FE9400|nr:hypothetical protein [Massilibacillus massiliensis]